MRKALTASILLLFIITAISCASVGVAAARLALYASRVVNHLRTAEGSAADRDALCAYYAAHHEQVEIVREFAKARWNDIPEQYKPALLAVNEQLNACDAETATAEPPKKTTARALLSALRRAVALYHKLHAAGII